MVLVNSTEALLPVYQGQIFASLVLQYMEDEQLLTAIATNIFPNVQFSKEWRLEIAECFIGTNTGRPK